MAYFSIEQGKYLSELYQKIHDLEKKIEETEKWFRKYGFRWSHVINWVELENILSCKESPPKEEKRN